MFRSTPSGALRFPAGDRGLEVVDALVWHAGIEDGFPINPSKDSGLVRSVSLGLGSHSQNRRLCSPSAPDAVIASCLPSPSLRKLRFVLHSDNSRSLRLVQIASHESLSGRYYRPFGNPQFCKSPSALRQSRLDCMARCAPSR